MLTRTPIRRGLCRHSDGIAMSCRVLAGDEAAIVATVMVDAVRVPGAMGPQRLGGANVARWTPARSGRMALRCRL